MSECERCGGGYPGSQYDHYPDCHVPDDQAIAAVRNENTMLRVTIVELEKARAEELVARCQLRADLNELREAALGLADRWRECSASHPKLRAVLEKVSK